MATCRALVWLSIVACLGCASPPEREFRFLHVTPTVTDAHYDPSLPLTVSLDLKNPSALLVVLPQSAIISYSSNGLVVRLDPYPALADPHPSALESTFLVDYEDAAVRELIGERISGPRPDFGELVAWVRETIEPAMDRGFDAASVIVETGRGDCTEFAVLTAALARSFGYPTRILIGLVIVRVGDAMQAFGHAWTEILGDRGWQVLDATPFEDGTAIGYLPQGALRDEGPGSALDFVRIYAAGITRVRILAVQRE